MDKESSKSRRERSVEMRDQDESPVRERWDEGHDNLEESGVEKRESGKHRSKDRSKSSRREEREHKSRERERTKTSDVSKEREKVSRDSVKELVPSKDKRADDREDRERDKGRDKAREKDSDKEKYRVKERESEKDRKDRGRKKERERERDVEKDSEREREKERGKEKTKDREKEKEKEKEKDRDGAKDRGKENDRDRHKERDKERENDRDTRDKLEKEKGKDRSREERETDQKKERPNERDKVIRKQRDEEHHRSKDVRKDESLKLDGEDGHYRNITKQGQGSHHDNDSNGVFKHKQDDDEEPSGSRRSAVELEERILKMKEERLKKKSEGSSDVLSWVSKSRKLEEKRNAEKEKALQLSRIFEEQDNIIQDESDDVSSAQHTSLDLAGVKILHGLDKVVEGGAVVLTLKDQNILADGDINQEVDMLENVEIGEQKRRNDAYGAAKKKTGTYVDKFNEEAGSEKKMLPQYDDPSVDEGVTLDARGRFSGEAEKKLEELRRRIDGASTNNQFEDLNSSATISSDYFTHEEMLKFKKPKKKKSLRKKDKLDLDALEAEARASGLRAGDLGSRNDGKRQALREEKERSESEKRSNAYQSAYEKADEASKALRLEQNLPVLMEEDDAPVFYDDDEDLRKSLERARKLSLRKQEEGSVGDPMWIALRASSISINSAEENEKPTSGEAQENKVVFTEMEEFVGGLQLDEDTHKPDGEDVFMEEDVAPRAPSLEPKEEDGGWAELKDTSMSEAAEPDKEEVVPDETIHEVAVGKGLSGALNLLKERGALKETIDWGGRNMDKKKSKLVGIYADDGQKEIRIERTDEYGRILTPKEAFRLLSHKFHGKGPGKMKQEKRMRQYQEELKIKQMKNADTPSSSVERMRDAQAQLKTPYLVLSGNVKPGQTSDPRSGFATVEKDFAGGLTPMLGDRKVEHFLGIKRKPEGGGDMGPPKKPKS